jgi:sodium-dependent dicarboxylate transporter 2/3/5
MLDKLAGTRILFFQWMLLSIPIMLVMAAALFAVMILRFPSKQRYDQSTSKYVGESRRQAGPWTRGQKNALVCFIAAVFLWVFPGIVASALGAQSALYKFCEQHIPEGVASLVAAILLFLLPTDWKKREFTLNWKQALRIDWGTILLFGGGLSLGNLMFSTKLADVVGQKVLLLSGVTSLWGLTGVFIALAIALTEVTSNTATASMLVPIAIALSKSLAVSPVPPAVGVCLGASMAFMMPVSTPSNAIIYGSGKVPMTSMITTGVILDLISFSVIFTGLRLLCPVLGLM